MAMYHPGHPNGNYEMANLVEVFDRSHVIAWKPGYDPGDGVILYGGWSWRYDLSPLGPSETEVWLSYDWSAVPEDVRRTGPNFPPFPPDHLHNSLEHLAELVLPQADWRAVRQALSGVSGGRSGMGSRPCAADLF